MRDRLKVKTRFSVRTCLNVSLVQIQVRFKFEPGLHVS